MGDGLLSRHITILALLRRLSISLHISLHWLMSTKVEGAKVIPVMGGPDIRRSMGQVPMRTPPSGTENVKVNRREGNGP